jgi:hypothetical protein
MPRSGRADELGIGSASPRMVEGGAVPASLMGGVWDPSAKLRRVGWFLHRNANGPERSRRRAPGPPTSMRLKTDFSLQNNYPLGRRRIGCRIACRFQFGNVRL